MHTGYVSACECFVWDLRRTGLVEPEYLNRLVAAYLSANPFAQPPELGDFLVKQGVLTVFQVNVLLQFQNPELVFGSFVIQEELGKCALGRMFKARSRTNKQEVALRLVHRRDATSVRLARRIVNDFKKFQHPAVVPLVDAGIAGVTLYLAWSFVEDETLQTLVRRLAGEERSLSTREVAQIGMSAAEGLDACHSRNIVHGHLRPTNFMVSQYRSAAMRVRILDFGINTLLLETSCNSTADTVVESGINFHSLYCVAPETAQDPAVVTPHSDQYSLGCILHYALTGRYPSARSGEQEQGALASPFRAIVARMLAKDPKDRFASLGEVAACLRPLTTDSPLLLGVEQFQPAEPPVVPKPAAVPPGEAAPTVIENALGSPLMPTVISSESLSPKPLLPSSTPMPKPEPTFNQPTKAPTQASALLREGIELAKLGKKVEARQCFLQVTEMTPRHDMAWFLLAGTARSAAEAIHALERVLDIRPDHEKARTALLKLQTPAVKKPLECPFCRAPRRTGCVQCSTCQAHLTLINCATTLQEPMSVDPQRFRVIVEYLIGNLKQKNDYGTHYLLGLALFNLREIEAALDQVRQATKLRSTDENLQRQFAELRSWWQREKHEAARRTVLVVDDSPTVCKFVTMILEKQGYRVVAVHDGTAALTQMAQRVPDLVLLDIMMPGADGYQVCKWIRSDPKTKAVPVVMLSGKGGLFSKLHGRLAGCTSYITKPFKPETLLETLAKYCPQPS